MKRVLFLLLFCSFLFAVPQNLSVQGRLQQSGADVTGDKSFNFSIYDAEAGGNLLWYELQTVPVQNGFFSALLGKTTVVNLAFDKDYWLNISVEGTSFPTRMKLASAPYAFAAKRAPEGLTVGPKTGTIDVVNSTGQASVSIYGQYGLWEWPPGSGITVEAGGIQLRNPRRSGSDNINLILSGEAGTNRDSGKIVLRDGNSDSIGINGDTAGVDLVNDAGIAVASISGRWGKWAQYGGSPVEAGGILLRSPNTAMTGNPADNVNVILRGDMGSSRGSGGLELRDENSVSALVDGSGAALTLFNDAGIASLGIYGRYVGGSGLLVAKNGAGTNTVVLYGDSGTAWSSGWMQSDTGFRTSNGAAYLSNDGWVRGAGGLATTNGAAYMNNVGGIYGKGLNLGGGRADMGSLYATELNGFNIWGSNSISVRGWASRWYPVAYSGRLGTCILAGLPGCEQSWQYCPAGYSYLGSIHTSPGSCNGLIEAEVYHARDGYWVGMDTGWVRLCCAS